MARTRVTSDAVGVDGLNQLRRGLKSLGDEYPKALRRELKQIGTGLAADVAAKVPRRSGAAAGSVRAGTSGTTAFVRAGGTKAPYYAWLDFGGGIPNKRNRGSNPPRISREFLPDGRYLFPTLKRERPRIIRESVAAFERIARTALPR